MESVFDIKVGVCLVGTAECLTYSGDWCWNCGEDNGGTLFCEHCGVRQPDKDDEDVAEITCKVCGEYDPETKNNLCEECDCDNNQNFGEDDYECDNCGFMLEHQKRFVVNCECICEDCYNEINDEEESDDDEL